MELDPVYNVDINTSRINEFISSQDHVPENIKTIIRKMVWIIQKYIDLNNAKGNLEHVNFLKNFQVKTLYSIYKHEFEDGTIMVWWKGMLPILLDKLEQIGTENHSSFTWKSIMNLYPENTVSTLDADEKALYLVDKAELSALMSALLIYIENGVNNYF